MLALFGEVAAKAVLYAAVLVARTNVTNAQTQVSMAQRALSYTVVAAPIDGFVLDRHVLQGQQ